jgi:hypothetical protein
VPADTNQAACERAGCVRGVRDANDGPLVTSTSCGLEKPGSVREKSFEIFFPNGPWMTRIPRSFPVVGYRTRRVMTALRPWLLR